VKTGVAIEVIIPLPPIFKNGILEYNIDWTRGTLKHSCPFMRRWGTDVWKTCLSQSTHMYHSNRWLYKAKANHPKSQLSSFPTNNNVHCLIQISFTAPTPFCSQGNKR
jgi:hypothetical protein